MAIVVMKRKRVSSFRLFWLLFLFLFGMMSRGVWSGRFLTDTSLWQPDLARAAASENQNAQQFQHLTPFMYRPYYGNRTILERTISFMDHDKPWYINDNDFVRYDGASWRGNSATVYDCYAYLSCYDGHNGYDLDLAFEPVLSVAGGTVIRSGWYNPLNHNSSFGLWVAIDHGNGIVSAYGHLSALLVGAGNHVGAQWQIGTSGTTGDSSGPHLHMSVFYLPNWQVTDPFGWHGRYADPNIVADKYLWVNSPVAHTASPYFGGSNAYPGAIVVDDRGSGWSATGSWHLDRYKTDINGSLHYAATSSGRSTATATWRPVIPTSGYYEVGVYIDDTHATSAWVQYTVYSSNPNNPASLSTHTLRLDSSHIGVFGGPYGTVNTGTRWVSIGTYYFHQGTTGHVVLDNGTGENGEEIAADAVEFVRVNG
jgi:murein DD-endopeptidase MepM/ murein hydrolase activator NlpD